MTNNRRRWLICLKCVVWSKQSPPEAENLSQNCWKLSIVWNSVPDKIQQDCLVAGTQILLWSVPDCEFYYVRFSSRELIVHITVRLNSELHYVRTGVWAVLSGSLFLSQRLIYASVGWMWRGQYSRRLEIISKAVLRVSVCTELGLVGRILSLDQVAHPNCLSKTLYAYFVHNNSSIVT